MNVIINVLFDQGVGDRGVVWCIISVPYFIACVTTK